MKATLLIRTMCAAALLAPLLLQGPSAQGVGNGTIANVIVKFKADSTVVQTQAVSATAQRLSRTQSLAQRIGVDLSAGTPISARSHVVSAIGVDARTLALRLAAQPDVEYAVPDEIVRRHSAPNDPFYAGRAYNDPVTPTGGGPLVGQWYLKPPGPTGTVANTAPSAINAEQAWDITTGNSSIVVAVIDTGIRFDHPDLVRVSVGGNLLDGYDFISNDNRANDGTQTGRDNDPSDTGDGVTTAEVNLVGGPFYHCTEPDSGGNYVGENSSWHGTQTTSMVGARTNDGVGMASVGRDVRILPIRALGKCGQGSSSDIIAGMRWAAGLNVPGVPDNPVANRARVINLSLGSSSTCSSAYSDAINEIAAAGFKVSIVASAGNEGMTVDAPANCAGVIAVTGVRNDGDKGGVSSLGPEATISAPIGNCPGTSPPCLYPILGAFNTGTTGPGTSTYTSSYAPVFTGTSFSAPLVAGAAGLMLSVTPSLTPSDIKLKLQQTARPYPTTGSSVATSSCIAPSSTAQTFCYCTTTTCGAGLLDVRAAVQAAVAAGVQAVVTVITTAPTAGQPVTLGASASLFSTGHPISSYQWTLLDGGGIVTAFTGPTNGTTVTATPSAGGTFAVRLTVTDDLGNNASATQIVPVAAAVVVVPVVPPSSSGGGGGGAVGLGWLILLLCAVLVLAVDARRARRRS